MIEGILRLKHPQLPDTTQFATAQQIPIEVERRGRTVRIPRLALFMVVSPHPRDASQKIITKGAWPFEYWVNRDREYDRYVGVPDPAYEAFSLLVPQNLERLKNLWELN